MIFVQKARNHTRNRKSKWLIVASKYTTLMGDTICGPHFVHPSDHDCTNGRRYRCQEDSICAASGGLDKTARTSSYQGSRLHNLLLTEALDIAQNCLLWRLLATLAPYTLALMMTTDLLYLWPFDLKIALPVTPTWITSSHSFNVV